MNSVFKLEDVVMLVSNEAKKLIPQMPLISDENKLLSELMLCILSSQEKYEVALAAMKVIKSNNAIIVPQNSQQFRVIKNKLTASLCQPLTFKINDKTYTRKLRFYQKKGEYISTSLKNIYLNDYSIREIIKANDCYSEVRKQLIRHIPGLGPKQASMFLRNIGYYSEFAVLDKHIIHYMNLLGLTKLSTYSNIESYQKMEASLKIYAGINNVNLLHLDLAIWTTMRSIKNIA